MTNSSSLLSYHGLVVTSAARDMAHCLELEMVHCIRSCVKYLHTQKSKLKKQIKKSATTLNVSDFKKRKRALNSKSEGPVLVFLPPHNVSSLRSGSRICHLCVPLLPMSAHQMALSTIRLMNE